MSGNTAENPLLDAALNYAGRGLRVFPVFEATSNGGCACWRGTSCPDVGKHPRTHRGFKDATCDETAIRAWWTRWPNANIGIRTGDDLVVIDIDVHDA